MGNRRPLLVAQEMHKGVRISYIKFHMIEFWVQIHGLEVDNFIKQNLERIGECIGKVIEVDDILGPMGLDHNYVRIKVEVNTTKPLLVGFWYTRRNGSFGRAKVKYERLLEFCFGCGKIRHIERVCKAKIVMSDSGEGKLMYGPWTRADIPRKREQKCRII